MSKVKVKIKLLHPAAKVPMKAHVTDAGVDLHAIERMVIAAGETAMVRTGLSVEMPVGYEWQIRPRSGFSFKKKVLVINSPGTVDAGFRGEVGVLLYNASPGTVKIDKGDRIAQAVLNELPVVEFEVVDELSASDRGECGFGSTGMTETVEKKHSTNALPSIEELKQSKVEEEPIVITTASPTSLGTTTDPEEVPPSGIAATTNPNKLQIVDTFRGVDDIEKEMAEEEVEQPEVEEPEVEETETEEDEPVEETPEDEVEEDGFVVSTEEELLNNGNLVALLDEEGVASAVTEADTFNVTDNPEIVKTVQEIDLITEVVEKLSDNQMVRNLVADNKSFIVIDEVKEAFEVLRCKTPDDVAITANMIIQEFMCKDIFATKDEAETVSLDITDSDDYNKYSPMVDQAIESFCKTEEGKAQYDLAVEVKGDGVGDIKDKVILKIIENQIAGDRTVVVAELKKVLDSIVTTD